MAAGKLSTAAPPRDSLTEVIAYRAFDSSLKYLCEEISEVSHRTAPVVSSRPVIERFLESRHCLIQGL